MFQRNRLFSFHQIDCVVNVTILSSFARTSQSVDLYEVCTQVVEVHLVAHQEAWTEALMDPIQAVVVEVVRT